VINELATIDFEKCVDCGKCSEVCPVKCIHVLDLTGEHAFVDHADI
jgi:NAD-dependent dihydropyrimidine dehydrogenase PreA subunit